MGAALDSWAPIMSAIVSAMAKGRDRRRPVDQGAKWAGSMRHLRIGRGEPSSSGEDARVGKATTLPSDSHHSTRADVLIVMEDVVGVVPGLHLHQPVVNGVAVRLADPLGLFVATEEIDVDALPEPAESGEEPPRPGGIPV